MKGDKNIEKKNKRLVMTDRTEKLIHLKWRDGNAAHKMGSFSGNGRRF